MPPSSLFLKPLLKTYISIPLLLFRNAVKPVDCLRPSPTDHLNVVIYMVTPIQRFELKSLRRCCAALHAVTATSDCGVDGGDLSPREHIKPSEQAWSTQINRDYTRRAPATPESWGRTRDGTFTPETLFKWVAHCERRSFSLPRAFGTHASFLVLVNIRNNTSTCPARKQVCIDDLITHWTPLY